MKHLIEVCVYVPWGPGDFITYVIPYMKPLIGGMRICSMGPGDYDKDML